MTNFQNSSTVNPISTSFINSSDSTNTKPKFLKVVNIITTDIMDA